MMINNDDIQTKVNSILSGGAAPAKQALKASAPRRQFSPFIQDDMMEAAELASTLMTLADEQGVSAAVAAVEKEISVRTPGLAQHALKLFMTHHPEARAQLSLESLEKRQPGLVMPSRKPTALVGKAAPEAEAQGGSTPPDNLVDYWREDPLINEHHEHWHLVYPTSGRPASGGGYQLGSRHGELFGYMHEQMLARYDAERLSAGLPRVQQFADYSALIPQGYDPGELELWDGEAWSKFRARPPGATWSDLTGDFSGRPGAKIVDQAKFYTNLRTAIENRVFVANGKQTPVSVDVLGNTEEANANSVDYYGPQNPNNNLVYGNHHNDGHIHFMLFDNVLPFGVMSSTATAVRDPIFFRWHKNVDSVYHAYQETLAPYDFAGGPRATIRKDAAAGTSIDLLLCRQDGMPVDFDGSDAAGNALAAEAFGPDSGNWNADLSSTTVGLSGGRAVTTTGELRTQMRTRPIVQNDGSSVDIDYLSHDDFYYFVRVTNLEEQAQRVTARIFLAPETQIEDRTAWIEMDRFSVGLEAGQRAVVYRAADQSSVIRKPALRASDLEPTDGPSPQTDSAAWCDCGWPYTLLLPRGTKDGMAFRLFVMLSDGDDLAPPPRSSSCTSISYCGLKDKEYPDKQAMGFPFDRPFKEQISSVIATHDNMASRKINISCTNP